MNCLIRLKMFFLLKDYIQDNKEIFNNDNDYITPMVNYTNTTLASFKEIKDIILIRLEYINKDIISKTKYYIRRIKLKELINENQKI